MLVFKWKTLKRIDANIVNFFSLHQVRRSYFNIVRTLLIAGWICSNLGIEKYISGVILYDETFYQKAADGTKFVDLLKSKGIVPGVKVQSLILTLLL